MWTLVGQVSLIIYYILTNQPITNIIKTQHDEILSHFSQTGWTSSDSNSCNAIVGWIMNESFLSTCFAQCKFSESVVLNVRQSSLPGHNEVWSPSFKDQPGIGLHPDPCPTFGQQPEDSEAALSSFYHCAWDRNSQKYPIHLLYLSTCNLKQNWRNYNMKWATTYFLCGCQRSTSCLQHGWKSNLNPSYRVLSHCNLEPPSLCGKTQQTQTSHEWRK